MPRNKSASTRTAPNIPSLSMPTSAAVNTTKQDGRSAVIKHAFAPSQLQLNLFASVVQGLNGQILRLHDTLTGKLRCEHSINEGKVSCLDWGYFGKTKGDDRPSKKRKTKDGAAEGGQEQGDAVIAIGTANSPDIEIFAPAKAKVIAVLTGAHSQGIKDFKFLDHGFSSRAWSLGGDGKLVEWNLLDGSPARSLRLPSQAAGSNVLLPSESVVLCAQSTIYGIDAERPSDFHSLVGCTANVHSMAIQTDTSDARGISSVIAAAETTREITLFNYNAQKIQGQMLATNPVDGFAVSESTNAPPSALVAITDSGEVELFERPFDFNDADPKNAKSAKAASRARTRRRKATIRLSRPGTQSDHVPILSAGFDNDELVIGWIEGGAHPCFDRIVWRGLDGNLLLDGETVLEKTKSSLIIANAKTNGLGQGRTHVDDSQAVVSRGEIADEVDGMEVDGPQVIDISSAEDMSSSEDEEEGRGHDPEQLLNGAETNEGEQSENSDAGSKDEQEEEDEVDGPSFGDLLRAQAPEPVDVAAAFPAKAQTALVPQGNKSVSLPSGMSLGAVLTQSLRTNDRDLLETCFHVQDLQVVRTTIERLDSSLAGLLLERLAERLHNRPGRAGSLMVWIQWTLVAHGGHLAGQPRAVKQLRQLHGVVKERAQALQPLLLLKGKLDMLDAQMQLRKTMLERSRLLQAAQEDDEEEAIYIEGQEEIDSDEEEVFSKKNPDDKSMPDPEDIEFDSDDDDGMPTTMEVDDEDDEEKSSDGNDMIDDEAEETDNDSELDDEEIDYDDLDSADEEEEDEDGDAASETRQTMKKGKTSKAKVNGITKRR